MRREDKPLKIVFYFGKEFKTMKKLFALLLALLMVASLSITAFAATAAEEKGTITINGVGDTTTYEIYKLLDLESYDLATSAYSYKPNAAWHKFFETEGAKKYFTVSDTGYVTWTWIQTDSKFTQDDATAAFAKMALAYAKNQNIAPVKSSENEGEFAIIADAGTGKKNGKFSELELGYYLVDSSMGALCGLTTTNPNAYINVKNGIPTIDKQVLEDSTEQWGAANTADIGQTVAYRVTINVHAGAENYVLHDTMENGLTFKEVTKIEHVIPAVSNATVSDKDYTVVTTGLTDGCDFEVQFTQDFCDHLATNDKVIVYYEAMLNRNAEIANGVNTNTAWLTFGDNGKSTEDSVDTKTFYIDIVKTDSNDTLIDGAKFKIYNAATGGEEVAVVILRAEIAENEEEALKDSKGNSLLWDDDNDEETEPVKVKSISEYRRARADEKGVEIVVNGGKIVVKGFDNGTYYLEETEAPDGYNKLTSRKVFTISDENLDAIFNDGVYSTGSGVHVVNQTGSKLPETGSFGTMLFITFGMFVMLATGVLLVTKKRMTMIED